MKIRELIQESKGIFVEVYKNSDRYNTIHTDNITCIYCNEFGILDNTDEEKLMNLDTDLKGIDYEVMDKEEYDNTVLANSDNYVEEESCPILVISIKEKILNREEKYKEILNNLIDLVGEKFDEDDIICCFEDIEEEIIISRNLSLDSNFDEEGLCEGYSVYINEAGSEEFKVYANEDGVIVKVY